MSGEVIRSSKQAAVRYERNRPGELVHMDVKKLGKIPDGGGWKAYGIPRIERLMTDNARAYRWSLRDTCLKNGIRQKFIRPHCLWQNGKVERLNRTLATEWACRQVFTSNDERTAALAPWIEYYNTERPHSALGGLPPSSRLPPTSWPGTPRVAGPPATRCAAARRRPHPRRARGRRHP
jgi:transposase InsO family protein